MRKQVLSIYIKTDKGYVGKDTEAIDFEMLDRMVKSMDGVTPDDTVTESAEVAKILRTITGAGNASGFHAWLEVNYDNGNGINATLIKHVVNYLLGRIGYQSLITMITVPCNVVLTGRVNDPLNLREGDIVKLDPFKLFVGLGVINLCKFLSRFGYYTEEERNRLHIKVDNANISRG